MKKFTRLLHHAKIASGGLVLENEKWWKGMISLYEDTEVTVVLERKKRKRTITQQGYLWAAVYPEISTHTGYTVDEVHEVMKALFLRSRKKWRGQEMTVLKSTQELTSEEFGEYITSVIQEAADLGISVPEPTTELQKVLNTI